MSDNRSILVNLVSQLKVGMDLSKVTLPTFILEPKSMLERIANPFQLHQLLEEAAREPTAEARFLALVKWYLASWHIAPKGVKKPLNPVLGEYFRCRWGGASYLAEQISHHPPKSAYTYIDEENDIRVSGVVCPQSRFLGNSSAAIMKGESRIEIRGEVYTATQPNVYARGILFGKMRVELGDGVSLAGNGYELVLEFKTKGFISGEYDVVVGVVKFGGKEIYKVSGKWSDRVSVTRLATGETSELFRVAGVTPEEGRVPEDQGAMESRRLWGSTIEALVRDDQEAATREKSRVEERQREVAKRRSERGEVFVPHFFDLEGVARGGVSYD
ncbi:uncharacterized protein LODBEIA_P56850 [Lodderomyces beijingensis]|uniref:Oxysterol-binding protein n=1 Tax=Lodderomyces beijingensis TaxID=1775926 RepID=A0ABP0ZL63_9ASCO